MNKLVAQKTLLISTLVLILLTVSPSSNASVGGKKVPPQSTYAETQDTSWWQELLVYFNLNS